MQVSPASDLTANLRGAVLMTACMAAFTVNDIFMKALSDELPLFQAIALRGIYTTLAFVMAAPFLSDSLFRVPRGDRMAMVWRVLCEAGGAFSFLGALFHMPFANAAAINQATPLVVSLAAAIWLRERLSALRIVAIVIGFLGVLLIVKPDRAGFNAWSLLVIVCVVLVTIRDLITRRMSHDIPALTIAFWGAIGVAGLASLAAVVTEDLRPLSLKAGLQMGGSAAFLVLGYMTAILTMRSGEVSFVAPFRYTSMLFALILAWMVFGEWPGLWTLVGAGIVIGAGLFTLATESKRRAPKPAPIAETPAA